MTEKFGLKEYQALGKELGQGKLNQHDVRIINIVCKVAGVINSIVAETREAITQASQDISACNTSIKGLETTERVEKKEHKNHLSDLKNGRNFNKDIFRANKRNQEVTKKARDKSKKDLEKIINSFR